MKTFLLLFTLFSSSICFKPTFPSTSLLEIQSLRRFVEIVKLKHLNTSIVISRSEEKPDVSLDVSISLTFPLNQEARTQANLNTEDGEKFLDLATSEKLAAKSLFCKENNQLNLENTVNVPPNTHAHRVSTILKNGKKNVWVDKNYISHYTFFSEEDGKNETWKVVFGNLDIEVSRSQNFTDEEIRTSEELLTKAFITYTSHDFGQALVAMFEDSFPGQKWQMVSNVNKSSYIKAKKMIELKLFNNTYLMYSI